MKQKSPSAAQAQTPSIPMLFVGWLAKVFQLELLALLTAFNYFTYNTAKISTGNSAARVLLAVGPAFGIGRPYTDLFEYVPPGLLVLLTTWIDAFGISMYSFRALHALLVFVIGALLILILRKTLRFWPAEVAIFVPLTALIFSRAIETDIFSIESFGTAFALAGVTALLYIKHPVTKLAIGSALLFAASQIKETYTLCALAMLFPYLDTLREHGIKKAIKIFLASLYGPLSVVAILVAYVVLHDAVGGYIYVLNRKLELVQHYTIKGALENLQVVVSFFTKNYLNYPQLPVQLIVGGLITSLLLSIQKIEQKGKSLFADPSLYSSITTALFCFGIFAGFMIYGQISHGMRMISIAIALYLLVGLCIAYPFRFFTERIPFQPVRILTQAILAIVISYFLMTTHIVLRDYQYNAAPPVSYNYFVENKIINKVSPDECILHLYGWEVPQTYIYTRRRPCTKFFLANLVQGRPARITEYQDEVVKSPPAAILYNTQGTDLNLAMFHAEVINFPNVIKHCYTVDPEVVEYMDYFFAPVTLYYKNDNLSTTDLRQCFLDYGFTQPENK